MIMTGMFSSLRIWLRKGFRVKTAGYFINLRPPVTNLAYYPSYDSSNVPVYKIDSWMMVIHNRKIAAIILYTEAR